MKKTIILILTLIFVFLPTAAQATEGNDTDLSSDYTWIKYDNGDIGEHIVTFKNGEKATYAHPKDVFYKAIVEYQQPRTIKIK